MDVTSVIDLPPNIQLISLRNSGAVLFSSSWQFRHSELDEPSWEVSVQNGLSWVHLCKNCGYKIKEVL